MAEVLLDKNSKTPLHHQLYLVLKKRILEEDLKSHPFMPSEADIQKAYDVSRITARRALSDLEHDGYIRKQRGMGTVILPRKKDRNISAFQGFSGAAKVKGDKPGSIIVKIETVEASVKVCQMLQLTPGEKVCFLKRMRLLNGELLAIHESYISLRFGQAVTREDVDYNFSLYDFLESKGIALGSADETVEARMPSNEVRRELYMDANVPLFYKERVTYDREGHPIEYSENSYIADRYKYNIHLENVREKT